MFKSSSLSPSKNLSKQELMSARFRYDVAEDYKTNFERCYRQLVKSEATDAECEQWSRQSSLFVKMDRVPWFQSKKHMPMEYLTSYKRTEFL